MCEEKKNWLDFSLSPGAKPTGLEIPSIWGALLMWVCIDKGSLTRGEIWLEGKFIWITCLEKYV